METSTLISFGDLLKTYRKQQGLTQQQLARKLGIHQNTIGAWERGDYLPATRGMILELARCLRLPETEAHYLLEASLLTATSFWSLPFPRHPFFTGRQQILQQLHYHLSPSQPVASCRSCALSGLAGIGKTLTALEYAYHYAPDYAAVFWVQAQTQAHLLDSFTAIAHILQLPIPSTHSPHDLAALVLDWLMLHRDWLLILDQVEDCALVKPFVPASRHGSLLLTTRLPTLGTLAPHLEVPPFSLEESMHLLLHRAEVSSSLHASSLLSTEEVSAVQAIATIMQGLPLALDLAAAYAEESRGQFDDLLALARHKEVRILQVHPASALYPHSVEETFLLAFERLQRQNPVAADLLRVCCFFAPDAIPEALVIRGACYLSAELHAALSDPFQLHVIFKDLLACALLRRNAQTTTLSIHRLVQTVLRAQMPDAVQREWVERLIRLLEQLFLIVHDQGDTKHQNWYEQVLPHVQHVLQLAEQWRLASPKLQSLLYKAESLKRQQREQGTNSSRQQVQDIQVRQHIAPQTTQQVIPTSMEHEDREIILFETFLQECCILFPQTSCSAAELWHAYQTWIQTREKEALLSRQAFTFQLKAKGCHPGRTNTSRLWYGIELKTSSRVRLRHLLP